jgi:hypothetical protein
MQQANPLGLQLQQCADAERRAFLPACGSGLSAFATAPRVVAKRTPAGIVWMGEPTLCDVLADPITQALMIADRVTPQDVDRVISTAASQSRF